MEQWKQIKEFPNYEVSNFGNIRSVGRFVKNSIACWWVDGQELKKIPNSSGYYRVLLYKDGKRKRVFVHRIVATEFIDNPLSKPCVNHLDNDPKNNNASNLEWCTHKENTEWMAKQGRNARTEDWLLNAHIGQREKYTAVIGESINTGEIIRFSCLNDVKAAGFWPSNVCNCCQGKRGLKQHKGYRWRYEVDHTA